MRGNHSKPVLRWSWQTWITFVGLGLASWAILILVVILITATAEGFIGLVSDAIDALRDWGGVDTEIGTALYCEQTETGVVCVEGLRSGGAGEA